MSSDYKNFSDYNDAAQDLRPTAKSQLVQRILNGVNTLSSLGQQLPLKWANAYKSFQVLKPVTGQNPEDVTSENAVSAVDSILYDTKSQLQASQEDIDTLCTEMNKIPASTQLQLQDVTKNGAQNFGNDSMFCVYKVANCGYVARLPFGNVGEPQIFRCDLTTYNNLAQHSYVLTAQSSDTPTWVNVANTYYTIQFGWYNGSIAQGTHPMKAAVFVYVGSTNVIVFIRTDNVETGESHSYKFTCSKTAPAPSEMYEEVDPDDTAANIGVAGSLYTGQQVPFNLDIKTALDLPDATSVIEAIDDLLS